MTQVKEEEVRYTKKKTDVSVDIFICGHFSKTKGLKWNWVVLPKKHGTLQAWCKMKLVIQGYWFYRGGNIKT